MKCISFVNKSYFDVLFISLYLLIIYYLHIHPLVLGLIHQLSIIIIIDRRDSISKSLNDFVWPIFYFPTDSKYEDLVRRL